MALYYSRPANFIFLLRNFWHAFHESKVIIQRQVSKYCFSWRLWSGCLWYEKLPLKKVIHWRWIIISTLWVVFYCGINLIFSSICSEYAFTVIYIRDSRSWRIQLILSQYTLHSNQTLCRVSEIASHAAESTRIRFEISISSFDDGEGSTDSIL